MSKWILAVIVVLLAAGCQQGSTFSQQQQDAQHRWADARAGVMLRVAENRLAAGELDDAHKAAKQAISLDPGCQEAKTILGRVLIEKGRYTEAAAELDRLSRLRPRDAQVIYYLGVAQEKAGRLEEALETYRRAYTMDEDDVAPIKAAAEVLVALGRPRPALHQVESYLPKAPDDLGMYELAGRLALMCGEYEKAAEYLQRLRDMDYRNLRYAELLARAQYGAGRMAQLSENLSELLDREDYQAPVWVYMMRGDSLMAQSKPKEAFHAFFSASERKPSRPEVWLALSRAALAMNDAPRAIGSAQRALGLTPGDMSAQLLLGMGLLKDRQPARAVLVLTEASKSHPRSATVQCLLGRAHEAMGQKARAVQCYSAALRIEPSNELARELLRSASSGEGLSRAQ